MNASRARVGTLFALLVTLAIPGWAQQNPDGDSDLVMMRSQVNAPPNVMLLFDSSLSMFTVVFSPSTNPTVVPDFDRNFVYPVECSLPAVTLDGTAPSYDALADYIKISNGGSGSPSYSPSPSSTLTIKCANKTASASTGITQAACDSWKTIPGATCTPASNVSWSNSGSSAQKPVTNFGPGAGFTLTAPDLDSGPNHTWWSINHLQYIFKTLRTTNALPPGFVAQTRVQAAKQALTALVKQINVDDNTSTACAATTGSSAIQTTKYAQRVRFAISRYRITNASTPTGDGFVTVPFGNCNQEAGLKEIRDFITSDGGTPLTAALINVGRYFTGSYAQLGGTSGYTTYNVNTSGVTGTTSNPTPASPFDPNMTCRKSFIVYITDGEPSAADYKINDTAYLNAFGTATLSLDNVTKYLANTDLLPDTPTLVMKGDQSVPVYTVGFGLDVPLLKTAATAGKASYYTAQDANQLTSKLKEAIDDILLRSATFAVGNVPASRTGTGDLYLRANFKPGARGQLSEGHLQAYRMGLDAKKNFTILNANGTAATHAADPNAPPADPNTPQEQQMNAEVFNDSTTPLWDAGEFLKTQTNRKLYFNVSSTTPTMQDFTTTAVTKTAIGLVAGDAGKYPNSAAVAASAGPPVVVAKAALTLDEIAVRLVQYAQGLDGFEEYTPAGTADRRKVVMGDIFHSDPLVIGAPSSFLKGEPGFGTSGDTTTFFGQNEKRDRVVYAGAGDGFLHAFNAGSWVAGGYANGDGSERFGFMPNSVIRNMRNFARADMDRPIFVDSPPAAADAWIPKPLPGTLGPNYQKKASEWKTTLVTGMRNGGKSYLALDVTSPSGPPPTTSYPVLLWEFFDPNLGYTWSKPVLTRLKVKKTGIGDFCVDAYADGDCLETWVAIFAGGYLPAGDPGQLGATPPAIPQAVSSGIYAVDLATGKRLAYRATTAGCSIPAQPAVVDENGDGYSDLAYVGDTCGNLLKWDLSKVGAPDASGEVTGGWPFGVFFKAPKAAFTAAPTTHYRGFFNTPSVSRLNSKITIAIGTGERTDLTYTTRNSDPNSLNFNSGSNTTGNDVNHIYVIRDDHPVQRSSSDPSSFPSPVYDLSYLTELKSDKASVKVADDDVGFFMVGKPNEKFITSPVAFAGRMFLGSFVWDPVATGGACSPRGNAELIRMSLADGAGDLTYGSPSPDQARRFKLGNGVPGDPKITTDADGHASISVGTSWDGGSRGGVSGDATAVDWIYWQER